MASSPARASPGPAPLWPLVAAAGLSGCAALLLSVWFLANSSAGTDLMARALAEAVERSPASFGRVQWGPELTRFSAVDVQAVNWQGRDTLAARLVSLEVDGADLLTATLTPRAVTALDAVVHSVDGSEGLSAGHLSARITAPPGGPVRLDAVVAEDFAVRLGWARDGQFSLDDAFRFKPPGPKPPPDQPDKARDPKKAVTIEGISLRRGVVTLAWPNTSLSFDAVDCDGGVIVGGVAGLDIRADLSGGRSAVLWREGARERTIAYDRVGIRAFRWRGEGFSTDGVALTGPDGARIALAGDLGVTKARAATVRGDAALSPRQARVLLGPLAPEGGGVADLDVLLEGGTVSGKLGRLEIPVLATGPTTLRGVVVPLEGTLASSALTAVTGKVVVKGARVRRLDGPEGVSAEEVTVGKLVADFGAAFDATVADLTVAGFTLPQGRVGRSNASGRVIVGLTGGRLEGRVDTPDGRASARGDISLSFLTQRATLRTALELKGLRGALARTVLAGVPMRVRAGLAEPLSGQAVYVGTVARRAGADGQRPWTPRFALEEGALEGGGRRVEYADERWEGKPAAASAAPDDEAAP